MVARVPSGEPRLCAWVPLPPNGNPARGTAKDVDWLSRPGRPEFRDLRLFLLELVAVNERAFFAKDQKFIRPLRCENCGGNAHLIRRAPDSLKRDGSEIRTFECPECKHQMRQTIRP
jgi:hypothetical protein